MKELIEYDCRRIVINAYTGSRERDLVMYKFSRDDEHPAKLKDLLFLLEDCINSNIPLENLSNEEIIYILYSIRGISVSDSLELSFKCECGNSFKVTSEISSIHKKSNLKKSRLLNQGYFKEAEKYIRDEILDSITMSSFDRLLKCIEKNKTTFNFIREVECPACGTKHNMDLSNLDILCSCFSNFDIMGFYNSINALVYYGRYDISSLLNDVLPFERELITELIQKEVDKRAEISNKYTKK